MFKAFLFIAMTTIHPTIFCSLLLDWYKIYQRDLPWRTTKDPYKIWLSEVILQQTRVAQGLAYYERFVTQYPSVSALASATEQEVLRLWQGLGYYSRARNLHYCACTIVEKYQGIFPTSYQELLTLKGIGPYIAAAIAAFSFKEVVAAVDGNVYRVLARIFGLTNDIGTAYGRKQIHHFASRLVDPIQPDTYSQAIMDFGAMQCKPIAPICMNCVFQPYCVAFQTNRQHMLPVKTNKLKKRKRYFDYFMVEYNNMIYMKQRSKGDIWQGMFDFYLIENIKRMEVTHMNDGLIGLAQKHQLEIITVGTEIQHVLTHQALFVQFYKIQATIAFLEESTILFHPVALLPFTHAEVQNLPKSVLIENFLQQL